MIASGPSRLQVVYGRGREERQFDERSERKKEKRSVWDQMQG